MLKKILKDKVQAAAASAKKLSEKHKTVMERNKATTTRMTKEHQDTLTKMIGFDDTNGKDEVTMARLMMYSSPDHRSGLCT